MTEQSNNAQADNPYKPPAELFPPRLDRFKVTAVEVVSGERREAVVEAETFVEACQKSFRTFPDAMTVTGERPFVLWPADSVVKAGELTPEEAARRGLVIFKNVAVKGRVEDGAPQPIPISLRERAESSRWIEERTSELRKEADDDARERRAEEGRKERGLLLDARITTMLGKIPRSIQRQTLDGVERVFAVVPYDDGGEGRDLWLTIFEQKQAGQSGSESLNLVEECAKCGRYFVTSSFFNLAGLANLVEVTPDRRELWDWSGGSAHHCKTEHLMEVRRATTSARRTWSYDVDSGGNVFSFSNEVGESFLVTLNGVAPVPLGRLAEIAGQIEHALNFDLEAAENFLRRVITKIPVQGGGEWESVGISLTRAETEEARESYSAVRHREREGRESSDVYDY
jgi:hypothetical protein